MISFAINSWEVITNHPILGVGTGDFPLEYEKINQKNKPRVFANTIKIDDKENEFTKSKNCSDWSRLCWPSSSY